VARYVAQVPMRWTDQDSYRHLNHARAVTLLEEARIALVFDESGLVSFSEGLLVAGLTVEYRRQVPYRAGPVRVEMSVRAIRAASFTIDYRLYDEEWLAIEAETRMALFDLVAGRPRRLTPDERTFLQKWEEVS
jgi:acyl-CoA thioester hydrolase